MRNGTKLITKARQKNNEAATSKPEDKSKPSILKPKTAAFVPNASALKEAAASMAAKAASPKTNFTKGDLATSEDGELRGVEGKPLTGQTSAVGSIDSSTASIFGGGTKAPAAFGSGFGSGSTTTFGKPSSFGSIGTGFGSAGVASGKSSFAFGSGKAEGGPASASTPSSSGFGGAAFLNIKPPGSSTGAAPQFSFGTSGTSITLPTPGATATNSKVKMFNAFSPPATSQSFGVKPLFGNTGGKKDEKEVEDGEMPDTKE